MVLPLHSILFNKYRIDAFIGQGAFARVYSATHLKLNAPRALKILKRDTPGLDTSEFYDYELRFELEAQLGARLGAHPHIIQVHDFEQQGETLALVMALASGGSLSQKVKQYQAQNQAFPLPDAARIARQTAEGLAALHALDAVHRDLKPSNILFDEHDSARVSDLGVVQIPGGPSLRSRVSQALLHPGTPGYMSPEQESTVAYLTPASDIYSLGLVLFWMLSGRMYRNLRPGTRLKELRPDTPAWLDDLTLRMLADDPRQRPWDGSEAARLLAEGERRWRAGKPPPQPGPEKTPKPLACTRPRGK
jgi:serine/threonine protein kinase